MTQSVWTPRVTVAAVIERDGLFLVVEETVAQGVAFNQPAGHLEDGESLLDAVRREVLEETAREFTPRALVGIYRWRMDERGRTYLRFCFHGGCSERIPGRELDAAIIATHWFSRAQLAASGRLRSPMVLGCVDDYLAGNSQSLDLLRDVP